MEIIRKYTDCSAAPLLQDTKDENGEIIKGYFDKVLADTLATGWGGKVKFGEKQKKHPGLQETPGLLPRKASVPSSTGL
jgi:hypothetical protein